jgi:glycosyltransferase involved in cell wall biosynthesis
MQNGAPDMSTLSGPQLHTLAVISGLQNLGHTVRAVAIQKNAIGWSDDLLTWSEPLLGLTKSKWLRLFESGLRRIQSELNLPFLGLFDSLHYADACIHSLKAYDLFYERHGYMGYGGLLAARWLGVPIVIEINGNIIKEIDEYGLEMSSIQRELGRWITYRTWSAANHIVVVSDALKRQLIEQVGIPERKISVVMNGVNIKIFSQLFDKERVREQFNINDGPVIAFVGSFQPWHGVDLLVASYKLVFSEFPNSQLILVGDGKGRDSITAQIDQLGLTNNVKLLGKLPQDQVAAILSIADIAVAPYPFEHQDIVGTPLKLMEYMAAGKAIIASTAPIHELIQDGITGIRVPPADIDALSKGMLRLLKDDKLRFELGSKASEQALENYSWERAVEKIDGIIRTQVSRKNGTPSYGKVMKKTF